MDHNKRFGRYSTPLTEKGKRDVEAVLSDLRAKGSTAGAAGITMAYEQAKKQFKKEGVNRVILATDGDFNVGISDTSQLTDLVKQKAKDGIEISVLGFGHGNLNDHMLELITNHGNGNYHYIDSERESHRVLAENISSTLQTIAKDVKIQVHFNPSKVKSYRLIGYANRVLNNEDFENDKVDAGEIGAGHSVTALYEVETHDGAVDNIFAENQLMQVRLRYKQPKGDESALITKNVAAEYTNVENASKDMKFASSVALCGMLHRDSQYRGFGNKALVLSLAENGVGELDAEAKQEFIELVKKSQVK